MFGAKIILFRYPYFKKTILIWIVSLSLTNYFAKYLIYKSLIIVIAHYKRYRYGFTKLQCILFRKITMLGDILKNNRYKSK